MCDPNTTIEEDREREWQETIANAAEASKDKDELPDPGPGKDYYWHTGDV